MKKILIFLVSVTIAYAHAYNPDHVKLAIDPKNMTLKDLDLRGANLANKNLTFKIFVSTDFRGANLSKAAFIGCFFIDCIFVDATVNDTFFQEAHFISCNLLKLVGTPQKPQNIFAPTFDNTSKLTMSGSEDVNLYFKNGAKLISPNVIASGLCRKIYDEAQEAQQNNH